MSFTPVDITAGTGRSTQFYSNQNPLPVKFGGNYYLPTVDSATGQSFSIFQSADQKTWVNIKSVNVGDGIDSISNNWAWDFDGAHTIAIGFNDTSANLSIITFDLNTLLFSAVSKFLFPTAPTVDAFFVRDDGTYCTFFGQAAGADQGFNMMVFTPGVGFAAGPVNIFPVQKPISGAIGRQSNGVFHVLSTYQSALGVNNIIYVQILATNALNDFTDFGAHTADNFSQTQGLLIDEVNGNILWSIKKTDALPYILQGSGLVAPAWSAITQTNAVVTSGFPAPYLFSDGVSLYGFYIDATSNQIIQLKTDLTTPLAGWVESVVFDGSQVIDPLWTQFNLDNASGYLDGALYFNNFVNNDTSFVLPSNAPPPSPPILPNPLIDPTKIQLKKLPGNWCCKKKGDCFQSSKGVYFS